MTQNTPRRVRLLLALDLATDQALRARAMASVMALARPSGEPWQAMQRALYCCVAEHTDCALRTPATSPPLRTVNAVGVSVPTLRSVIEQFPKATREERQWSAKLTAALDVRFPQQMPPTTAPPQPDRHPFDGLRSRVTFASLYAGVGISGLPWLRRGLDCKWVAGD